MKRFIWLIFLALIVLATVTFALAQNSSLDLPWFTVDGGGTTAVQGGSFALKGTVGQADAGSLSGGPYRLSGGFLHPPVDQSRYVPLYLPLLLATE